MKLPSALGLLGFAMVSFTALPLAGHAGPVESLSKSIIETVPPPDEASEIFNFRSSYVFASDFERGNGRFGEQDALNSVMTYAHRFQLSGQWYLRLGMGYSRFDFGSSPAPLPNHLQAAQGIIAVEYLVNGQTGFLFETRPGAYFENEIRSDAFDAPTVLALAVPIVKDSFYVVIGALYTGFREYTVLPVLGATWTISDRWKLSALFPNPRLVYSASDSFKIWAGAELVGGAYRTDDRSKKNDRLDYAVLDYSEYRGAVGVTIDVCPGFSIDAGAGWAFQRRFEYPRADQNYTLEGAPAITLRGTASF